MIYPDNSIPSLLDMNISQKTQDILHWILVIALTGTALEPSLKPIVPAKADAILAIVFAGGILFNYYATTTQGTTAPQPPQP